MSSVQLARHASVHAAGVIVATRPLYEIVPLYKPAGEEESGRRKRSNRERAEPSSHRCLLTSKTLCPQQAAADARAFAQWKRSPHARAAQARITPRSLLDGSALKNLFYPKLPTN